MGVNYPKGQAYFKNETTYSKKQDLATIKKGKFANRGMVFEEAINQSNQYFLDRQIAVIHKKPTPVQIVKVDYPNRSAAVIKEAYFTQPSTTDYNGVYQGYYIDFEAKATKNKTSFPLNNFHEHQIEHMRSCVKQQGICFVLVWFSSLKRCFFLEASLLLELWDNQEKLKRKSIPLTIFESSTYEINLGIAPQIPYLEAVDKYILKLKEHING
ncbi:Holliday junction resolvase RecU [Vagococcus entomophilus]|uniref:Holliday junction resolvase RecU n=1 Tax=Vagococcus entomophilus TaxID=1160095 RepID=A0A430AJR1_9ENTE|nr:Holliday junction resolvase RecU [Vagococcus entomophilus]RSU08157.1 Holliday junction resolvase RecU [Vagococcus entomophilus]